jgi:hypothetical protein
VGKDPSATKENQLLALRRALIDRCRGCSTSSTLEDFPLNIVESENLQFLQSKSQVKYRLHQQKLLISSPTTTNPATSLSTSSEIRSEIRTGEEHPDSQQKRKKPRLCSESQPCGYCINWQIAIPASFLDELSLFSDLPFILRINSKITPLTKVKTPSGLSSFLFAGSQEVTIAHTGLPQGITTISTGFSANGKSQKHKSYPVEAIYKKKICVSRISGFALHQLMIILFKELSISSALTSSLPFPPLLLNESVEDGETVQLKNTGQITLPIESCGKGKEEILSRKMWKEKVKSSAYKNLEDAFFTHPIFQHWIRCNRTISSNLMSSSSCDV